MSRATTPPTARIRDWLSDWTRRSAARFGLQEASALSQWRGRVLAALLGAALVIGAPTLLFAVVVLGARGLWHMVLLDVVAYALTPYVLFSRTLPYRLRAWTLVASLLAIGALALMLAGFATAGPVWLCMAALAAGLLLGVRAGIAIVLVNAGLFIALGVGMAHGAIRWADGIDGALALWTLSALNTAMMGLMATVSVGVLVNGLEREAEARLRAEAERRRGQQLEALGTLAGGIAHDFNNLLAPILANVDLLADSADADQRELLVDIRSSAVRGRDLVKRLLMLRKGEGTACVTSDVSEVVREAARLARARAAAGVRLEVRAPHAVRVHASSAELHQIVMNLVTNSVQAMTAGGVVVVEVEPSCEDGRGVARLTVRDNGSGMSAETRERAFEPFFTTKTREGNGLGLATVRSLVMALGGTIELDSAPGIGTVVTVTLPSARAPVAPSTPPSVADRAKGGVDEPPPSVNESGTLDTSSGSARTILVVDDDPIVLETARRVVSALGHDAVAVSSAAAAEAWFAEHADDCALVVTDYRMPGRSGAQLIAALRRRQPNLPALVVSGFDAEAACEVRSLGTQTALLPKPYGMSELRAAIDAACAGRGATAPRGG